MKVFETVLIAEYNVPYLVDMFEENNIEFTILPKRYDDTDQVTNDRKILVDVEFEINETSLHCLFWAGRMSCYPYSATKSKLQTI